MNIRFLIFQFIPLTFILCDNTHPTVIDKIDVSFYYNNKQYFKFPKPYVDDHDIDHVADIFTNKNSSVYQQFLCIWHYMSFAKNAVFTRIIERIINDLSELASKSNFTKLKTNIEKLGVLSCNCTAYFYKNKKLINSKKLPKPLQKKTLKIVSLCKDISVQLNSLSQQVKAVYVKYHQKSPNSLIQYIDDGAILYKNIAKSFEQK